ncbi:MAG: imidazolonepropionase [Bacteroidota bacterium]
MNLLITNIGQLITVASNGAAVKTGADMQDIGVIENATVRIIDGNIERIGPSGVLSRETGDTIDTLDADGRIAVPGFVDAHTHACFVDGRHHEFALRSRGASDQEIDDQEGGILSTVKSVRSTTRKDLKRATDRHLDAMLRHGTTTVEIKTGYGLNMESEITMLEAIQDVQKEHYVDVVPTFLPAHAVPPEYREDRAGYIRSITEKMIPYVGKRKLARYCDVVCERGFFSVEETREILTVAKNHGMQMKIHAEKLTNTGGTELGVELNAVSVDHLEHVSERGIKALQSSRTIAVLLPGVSFFLNRSYAPARALIDAGIPVALASDFNPDSCMSFSMPLMMTIACTHMRMTPEEAITASTLNAAAAIGVSDRLGSIEVGKKADIIILDIPHYLYISYFFGVNHVWRVIKNGTILEF